MSTLGVDSSGPGASPSRTSGGGSADPAFLAKLEFSSDTRVRAIEEHALRVGIAGSFDTYADLIDERFEKWRDLSRADKLSVITEAILDRWREIDLKRGANSADAWMNYRENSYQIEQARAHAVALATLVELRVKQKGFGIEAGHKSNFAALIGALDKGGVLAMPLPAPAPAPAAAVPAAPVSTKPSSRVVRQLAAVGTLVGAAALVAISFFAPFKSRKAASVEPRPPNNIPSGQLLTAPSSLDSLVAPQRLAISATKQHAKHAYRSPSKPPQRKPAGLERRDSSLVVAQGAAQDSLGGAIAADSLTAESPATVGENAGPSAVSGPKTGELSLGSAQYSGFEMGKGTNLRHNFLAGEGGDFAAMSSYERFFQLTPDLGGTVSLGIAGVRSNEREFSTQPAASLSLGYDKTTQTGFEIGANIEVAHGPELLRRDGHSRLEVSDRGTFRARTVKWFGSKFRIRGESEAEYAQNDLRWRGTFLKASTYKALIGQPEVPNDWTIEPYAGVFHSRFEGGEFRNGIAAGFQTEARHKNTFLSAEFGVERSARSLFERPEIGFVERVEVGQQLNRSLRVFVEHRFMPAQGTGFLDPNTPLSGATGWRAGIRFR